MEQGSTEVDRPPKQAWGPEISLSSFMVLNFSNSIKLQLKDTKFEKKKKSNSEILIFYDPSSLKF